MALEIFVIYNKNTGLIGGGVGRVDRSAMPDGTTMFERIPEILAKDPDREVLYLLNRSLPDPDKQKVKNGQIVDMKEPDCVTEKLNWS